MSNEILKLEPALLWKYFHVLTQVPRPSGQQAEVVDFIRQFGERLQLETFVDEVGNVIIRKGATPGLGAGRGVILQAHLDMVPQKNSSTQHDFSKDPIRTRIENGAVVACGTTLGADNGIGVAAILAVLESRELRHGPLEALFTVDEEVGMVGAFGLRPGVLQGDVLLNLDSEDEGELYIGCAGGVDTDMVFHGRLERTPSGQSAFALSVCGLQGGHSGLDIDHGLGNACLIMGRLLQQAAERCALRLAAIDAGSLRNAIPREALATVSVPLEETAVFLENIEAEVSRLRKALGNSEPYLDVNVAACALPARVIDRNTQSSLFDALHSCPNGVFSKDQALDVVLTSSNLAFVKSSGAQIRAACLTRGACDEERDAAAGQIADHFRRHRAEVSHSGAYPGWVPNPESPVLAVMREVYRQRFGRLPAVKVVHAGLECGILGSSYPRLDMVSFGPTIQSPHSPDERVDIASVCSFWDYLVEVLAHLPVCRNGS